MDIPVLAVEEISEEISDPRIPRDGIAADEEIFLPRFFSNPSASNSRNLLRKESRNLFVMRSCPLEV